jgi:mannose-6-phosphate isomerase-like protein (cupin superfamily)
MPEAKPIKSVNALEAHLPQNPHGVAVRALHNTEHVTVSLVTLQPGEKLKRHITPVDAVFYVLQGQATVEIGEERETVLAHHLVDSPARIPHRVLNEGDETVRFLVIKAPRQTEQTQVL